MSYQSTMIPFQIITKSSGPMPGTTPRRRGSLGTAGSGRIPIGAMRNSCSNLGSRSNSWREMNPEVPIIPAIRSRCRSFDTSTMFAAASCTSRSRRFMSIQARRCASPGSRFVSSTHSVMNGVKRSRTSLELARARQHLERKACADDDVVFARQAAQVRAIETREAEVHGRGVKVRWCRRWDCKRDLSIRDLLLQHARHVIRADATAGHRAADRRMAHDEDLRHDDVSWAGPRVRDSRLRRS